MPDQNFEDNSAKKDKIKELEDRIEEIHDLELVNKLDIVNLKNDIDKLKLGGMPSPMFVEERRPEVLLCRKCSAVLPMIAKYCGKCGEKVK